MQNTVDEDAKLTLLYTELLLCQKFTPQSVSNIDCAKKFHIPFSLSPHPIFLHISLYGHT